MAKQQGSVNVVELRCPFFSEPLMDDSRKIMFQVWNIKLSHNNIIMTTFSKCSYSELSKAVKSAVEFIAFMNVCYFSAVWT